MQITERQYEIIEAAGRILTASGVGGLTIKKLAKEMDFSEAAIYRHFKNKETILINMLQYLAHNMDERFEKIDRTMSHEDRFKAIFNAQINFFNTNKHFVVVVFSDGLLEESDRINQQIYNIMQVKMKHLLPVIRNGQQMGVFTKKITPEEMTHIIMGSFRLQMYKWRVSNFELDIKRIGNNLIESLLTLLKTK
ncbi:MAG: TetR/AcrR family fatty acid metabolism transcriptional regulator [Crocinitomix sp.]|jgi:TetR/AcrR family fatty acid metabolism transcriptional regulator